MIRNFFFIIYYWTKSDRVFGQMQIITYSVIILNHTLIHNFESFWCWKSNFIIFGGQIMVVSTQHNSVSHLDVKQVHEDPSHIIEHIFLRISCPSTQQLTVNLYSTTDWFYSQALLVLLFSMKSVRFKASHIFSSLQYKNWSMLI